MAKRVFLVNGLCLETKQMWLKPCVTRNGDPCLKPSSFSQPQIFFWQFVFMKYARLIRCYNALIFTTLA